MFYEFSSPAEMRVYVNTGYKSLDSVKKLTGADVISNFQMFNSNWTACCFTKVDGKVIGTDGYVYEGFGWNKYDGRFTFDTSNHHERYENFAGALLIVKDGKYPAYDIIPAIRGTRGRTALGMKADGTIVLWCSSDSNNPLTIPKLAERMIAAGCKYAINFDGGGKSQCITPKGGVYSNVIVHTMFYAKLEKEEEDGDMNGISVPTLSKGDRGTEAVKSLQQLLICKGYSCGVCGADGDFGGGTLSALNRFKAARGLPQDGVADNETWERLING